MVISSVITAALLIACSVWLKEQKHKDLVLKISAVATVALHFSNLWVDYFTTGSASMENNQLLPVYPCNIMMWLLLIAAFWKNKESTAFTVLAEFTFWAGVVCGTVGIAFNVNYDNNPNLLDYDIFKGLISHSTMLFGCIYVLVGKYIQIRVFNVVSCIFGLLLFVVDGMLVNAMFAYFKLPPVNAMYLQQSPIPGMPWLSPVLMGAAALLLLFAGLALYELRLPQEERWYSKLKLIKDEFIKKTKEKRA